MDRSRRHRDLTERLNRVAVLAWRVVPERLAQAEKREDLELIDEIVYELYGLTEEEIEIVEEAVKS